MEACLIGGLELLGTGHDSTLTVASQLGLNKSQGITPGARTVVEHHTYREREREIKKDIDREKEREILLLASLSHGSSSDLPGFHPLQNHFYYVLHFSGVSFYLLTCTTISYHITLK